MRDPLPAHPYPAHTRVHDVGETDRGAMARGTADVLDATPRGDGTYLYLVRLDADDRREEWPSYFTIPAGTWASAAPAGAHAAPGA
ncbi:hypothetical protein ACFPZ0_13600 [Streptomonospora nanhaiensis]|uniref:Uncharacterized protein n=1 Tax=Streptomonospora nanhaiensis TaxID=1323731 RepID=A0A853BI71_9ACTN|nr:hypothetical protein [Streptomonospora nanhaiensis]MBV2366407.1 hypothetical protein [Streptomonospora nanhaiensis]MBX9389950.1 hypothetical protein [Streptomonospora nanhaiensis]NYI94226.1 hypothetical protein [Streptomonospora nanhaiensis]